MSSSISAIKKPLAPRPLRCITLLDTSIASTNVGDQIIMDAVKRELAAPLADCMMFSIASHERMASKGRKLIRSSDYAIAGGSNLLSSHLGLRSVWRLSPMDALLGQKFVMMGVGWYHDQGAPDPYTAFMFRRLFARDKLHSVRDSYTLKKLQALGFDNVVNTGCPTLWSLPDDTSSRIPAGKARAVVTTINTYMPDREADRRMLEILTQRYETVFGWIQTDSDHAYLRELCPTVQLLDPSLAALDTLLTTHPSLDYVGTRLHGGIRALQKGRRTLIVEIDNRAREMGRDFGLPTLQRDDFAGLIHRIENPFETKVHVPREVIARWKSQWARPGLEPPAELSADETYDCRALAPTRDYVVEGQL